MDSASFRTLHFAARPRVVARYLGQILLAAGLLSAVPGLVSLATGNPDIALRYLIVMLVLGAVGFAASRLQASTLLQTNEAMLVTALAFLLSGLAMSYPMMGYGIAPLDAIFEAVSGVTTTGLSTLESVDGRPASFLFARAWLQWIGGLGVVVLVLAFIVPGGVAAKRLGFDDREAADYAGGTRAHARRILGVYLALSIAGTLLCLAAGLDAFPSLLLALSAVSTGGFAPTDASLIELAPAGQAAVGVVCLSGAVSFSAYYASAGAVGALRAFVRSSGVWLLLALCAGGGALLALLGVEGPGGPSWHQAAWMSVSAQTTAGFSTLSPAALTAPGKLILIGQMLVGGDMGSTAGGLKILRLVILANVLIATLLRVSMPASSRLFVSAYGSKVEWSELEGVAALALAYAGVLALSWLAFLVAGHEPLDALFDVASALGTAGLSTGVTGPDLQPWLKGVLCLDMLMGRLEIVAFLVLVFPQTWLGRRRTES